MTETSPQLVHTTRGDTVSYNDRFLYSRRDPQRNPEEIAGSVTILPQTLIIIPSPLLFHGVSRVLSRLPSDCHILCVEIDQSLMAFSIAQAPQGLIEKDGLSTIRTASPTAFTEYISKLQIHKFRRILPLFLSGGYTLHKAGYDILIAAADRHIQRYWQNRITLVHMSRMWIKNIISNLVRSWRYLGNRTPSSQKPVVVAGAGESLEKALDSLHRYRSHFYLLAVDTALPVLAARDIFPDAVVVLEGQLVNSAGFFGHGNREMTLICDLSAHPSTLDAIHGTKHFILSDFSSTLFLNRLLSSGLNIHSIPPMGSVGVVAVDLARSITSKPVLLTGLDFCYVLGKPHSRGAPSHINSLTTSLRTHPLGLYLESMKRPLMEAENGRGERITTDLVLRSYGDDLDASLQTEDRIFDMREGGLPLNSVAVSPDDGFWEILDSSNSTGEPLGKYNKKSEQLNFGNIKEAVKRFLENERLFLNEFLSLYQEKELESAREPADPRLINALTQVDYIYLDFPDAHDAEKATEQFLVRAAASAADLRDFLENALQFLD